MSAAQVQKLRSQVTGSLGACNAKLYNLNYYYYYNILDNKFTEKFRPDSAPILCPNSKCWCSPETHIAKSKVG